MPDSRGIPGVTFADNNTAVEITYRVIADHTITVPLDELPFEVDDVYSDEDELSERDKLDVLAEYIEADLEAIVEDDTDHDNADNYDYVLDFTPQR